MEDVQQLRIDLAAAFRCAVRFRLQRRDQQSFQRGP